MLSIFPCVCWLSVCLHWQMSVQVLCPFINQVWGFFFVLFFFFFCIELYVFLIYFPYQPFSGYITCNYLRPVRGLSFHLVGVFLHCAKVFVSYSSICLFLLLFPSLRIHIQKNISKSSLLMFSSSFMVSRLTFKPLIHFILFSYICKKVVQFHSFQYSCPVLLKRLSFFHLYSYYLFCHRLADHMSVDLFLDSLFCSLDLCVLFLCQFHTAMNSIAL